MENTENFSRLISPVILTLLSLVLYTIQRVATQNDSHARIQ